MLYQWWWQLGRFHPNLGAFDPPCLLHGSARRLRVRWLRFLRASLGRSSGGGKRWEKSQSDQRKSERFTPLSTLQGLYG